MKRHSTPQPVIKKIIVDAISHHVGQTPLWARALADQDTPLSSFIAMATYYRLDTLERGEYPVDGPATLTRLDGETMTVPVLAKTDWPTDLKNLAARIEKAVHTITDWADSTHVDLVFSGYVFIPERRDEGNGIDTNGDTVEEVEADMLDYLNSGDWSNGDYRVVRYEQKDTTIPSLAEFDPLNGDLTIVIEGTDTFEGVLEETVCYITAAIDL